MEDCAFKGTYKTEFTVHKTGSVSIGNIRYGASTHVARCLNQIARDQVLEDKEITEAKKIRTEIVMEARDKIKNGLNVADAVEFVKNKHNLNKILTEDITDSLIKYKNN